MASWRCSPRGWLERLWSSLPAALPQKRAASSLAEPDSCFIETSIGFVLHPCFQTMGFLPLTAKMSVFEGSWGREQNASSFKDQNNKYRIPFSLTQELFFFKASGKTCRKHTRQQNKCASKSCFSPLTIYPPKMGFSSSKPGS